MGYSDFKDLSTRTAFDKVLRDKVLHIYIAKNPKYDGCPYGLVSLVDENSAANASSGASKSEII